MENHGWVQVRPVMRNWRVRSAAGDLSEAMSPVICGVEFETQLDGQSISFIGLADLYMCSPRLPFIPSHHSRQGRSRNRKRAMSRGDSRHKRLDQGTIRRSPAQDRQNDFAPLSTNYPPIPPIPPIPPTSELQWSVAGRDWLP